MKALISIVLLFVLCAGSTAAYIKYAAAEIIHVVDGEESKGKEQKEDKKELKECSLQSFRKNELFICDLKHFDDLSALALSAPLLDTHTPPPDVAC